jgi:hypothetical protein
MKLVDDARECWKWISMWCMTLAGAIQGSWMFIPDDMKASIPAGVVQAGTVALLALGMAGRLLKQTGKDSDNG